MKKKLALLLAAVMVAAMVPATAFAKSTNHVTKAVVVEKNTYLTTATAPVLNVKLDDGLTTGTSFELVLDGAEWKIPAAGSSQAGKSFQVGNVEGIDYVADTKADFGAVVGVGAKGTWVTGNETYNVVLLDSQTLSVRTDGVTGSSEVFKLPMWVKVTGETAAVTVVPNDTEATAGTYTFATTTSSAATVKSQGIVETEIDGNATTLKSIVITETVAGALKKNDVITLKLYGDFKFTEAGTAVSTEDDANDLGATVAMVPNKTDEITVTITGNGSKTPAKLSLVGIKVQEAGAKAGDIAEIVVKGSALDNTTLEVVKAVTYGVSFTAADKKMPVLYAGKNYKDGKETLEVTFKELAADSWWDARKTTLTFPEDVKVVDIDETGLDESKVTIKNNVVTIAGGAYNGGGTKAEWKMDFELSISPKFQGEVTCTIGGPALAEDITVVVAEADYPVTFEVEAYDVSIDYRNVKVGNITITETYAGALEAGKDLYFFVDEIALEGNAKVEVEGDIEVELEEEDNMLWLHIVDDSYKAASTITITGVEAYLQRDLPAGKYALEVGGYETVNNVEVPASDAYFQNYGSKSDVKTKTDKGFFNIASLELAEDYITVVTAGRDQDDSTFTTQVAVTIGANTMNVGGAVVALDVPAYNANGYIMLPVRAVADALSATGATVLWDGATQTVTIAFGARIISMTVGSKVMNINGVAIATTTAPEITNGRTFLGIRDLGYALGLTDADINYNDETKTATLN